MSDLSHPLDVAVQERSDDPGMQRSISWNGAFWIASGVPRRPLRTPLSGLMDAML